MKTIIAAAVLAIGMTAVTVNSVGAAQPTPGAAPGYGPGAAMMGGYGGGYGMMGGYGPGMMGGGAYGPGMMRGGPDWAGAGYGGPLALPDLSDEQREKLARIQEESRTKNWTAMGQLRGEQFKLRQMYLSDKVDPAAYAEQQRKVDELRRTMLKSRIEARNQMDAALTKEQRQQFRSFGPWWQGETVQ